MAETKPEVFTPAELAQMRADIDSHRRPGAYQRGKWSVSPLNREPAIVGRMPPAVRFRDVTLRSIDNLAGVDPAPELKRVFLRRLLAAGVPELVTGGVRGRTEKEVREELALVREVDGARRVTCPLVLTAEHLRLAATAGYDAVQIWVPPWGVASRTYEPAVYASAWRDGSWREDEDLPRDRQGFVDRAVRLIETAKAAGLEVTAPLLMVSYLEVDALVETCGALVTAGVDEVGLFDGPGAVAPGAIAHLVAQTKASFPRLRVSTHPHNTFGLAVAAAVAAAQAGADTVEVSVNGYCGGPGNADLAAATAAFEALYGVPTGIASEQLKPLSEAAQAMTGYPIAFNHPITGPLVYNWGGLDFMTQETSVDPVLHNCVDPGWSGSDVTTPITDKSGPFTVWDRLVEVGVEPTRRLVDLLVDRMPDEVRERGRLLTDDELRALVARAQRQIAG